MLQIWMSVNRTYVKTAQHVSILSGLTVAPVHRDGKATIVMKVSESKKELNNYLSCIVDKK